MNTQKKRSDQPKIVTKTPEVTELSASGLTRNKGGRPLKAPEEICSETFLLYFTPAEINQLHQLHKQASQLKKLSANQFIKNCVFQRQKKGKGKSTDSSGLLGEDALTKTLTTLIRIDMNLGRIGSNYNQSAHRLNSMSGSVNVTEELRKQLALLTEIRVLKEELKVVVNQLKNHL